jgi:hypothetical protein
MALEKQARGVKLIAIREVIYQLVTHTLAIQFTNTFVEHFSPHQFGVGILGGCETMVHGVGTRLDIHSEWVVLHVDVQNVFNSVFQATIFKELWSSIGTFDQLFPFVHRFYAHPFPLYFSKVFKHGDFIVISFEFGTR